MVIRYYFKRASLNSWCYVGKVCGGMSFLLIVMQTANGLSDFAPLCRRFLFLHLLCFFGRLCLKAPLGDCFWKILASGTWSRPQGLLQTLSLLIDNSLLKTFLQRSTTRLDTIIISSYHLLCCNFLYVNFVYCLREKQPTKQINNQKISLCIT